MQDSIILGIVCLNAAGSVKENTASSARTCFIVNIVLQRVITVKTVKHHSIAPIPSVKINVAKIAVYSFVGNVRRDSVQAVHWAVNVVTVQFVTVVITKEGMIVGYARNHCALSARCNANSARTRSAVVLTAPWTALTVQYASRRVRFEEGIQIYILIPVELPRCVSKKGASYPSCCDALSMISCVWVTVESAKVSVRFLQNLKHVFRQFEYRCTCDSSINRQAAPSNGDELGDLPIVGINWMNNPANNLIHQQISAYLSSTHHLSAATSSIEFCDSAF